MSLGSASDFKGKTAQDLFADVIDRGLCTACGTCVAVCAQNSYVMVGEEVSPGDELRAKANESCNACGMCYAVCPGERVNLPDLEKEVLGSTSNAATDLLGQYRHRYVAHATDEGICKGGASAGTAAALQVYALEKGLIDGVLGVGYDKERPWVPVPVLSTTRSEILSTQGSKYTHCSVNDALKEIASQKLRIAVVGLPCHIHGLRKLQHYQGKGRLAKSIVFMIGLFCAENRFTRGAEHMITRRLGIPLENVARISYREGEYPGAFTVWDKDGKTECIPYPDVLTYLWMHTRPRCRLCWDYTAEVADISLGETKIKSALNAALVRTEIGSEIFQGAMKAGYVSAEEVEEQYIIGHTGLERKKYANLMRLEWARSHGMPTPNYPDPSVRYEDLPPFFFSPQRYVSGPKK